MANAVLYRLSACFVSNAVGSGQVLRRRLRNELNEHVVSHLHRMADMKLSILRIMPSYGLTSAREGGRVLPSIHVCVVRFPFCVTWALLRDYSTFSM